jgi:hypothetical protein
MNYRLGPHALERMAQRNLSNRDLLYVIRYGRENRNAGALHIFLAAQDVPARDRANQRVAQLVGTNVLIDEEYCEILTVYRNREGNKHHRKKEKYHRHRRVA